MRRVHAGAVPPLTSSTPRAGPADSITCNESGTVRSTMLTIRPSPAMNSMSSGISVFFIHIVIARSAG